MELKDLPYEMIYEICTFCDRRTQEGLKGKHEYIDNYIDRRPIDLNMINRMRMMLKTLDTGRHFYQSYGLYELGIRELVLKKSGRRAYIYRSDSVEMKMYNKDYCNQKFIDFLNMPSSTMAPILIPMNSPIPMNSLIYY